MITVSTDVIASASMVPPSRLDMRRDSAGDMPLIPRGGRGGKPKKKKRDPLERLLSDESMFDSDNDDEKHTGDAAADGAAGKKSGSSSADSAAGKLGSPHASLFAKKEVSAAPAKSLLSSALSESRVASPGRRGGDLASPTGGRRGVPSADDAFYDALGLTGFAGGRGGAGGRQAIGKPGRDVSTAELDYSSDDSDIAMFSGGGATATGVGRGGSDGRVEGTVEVCFEEHLETVITVNVPSVQTSVGQFVSDALTQFFKAHPKKALKGHKAEHYDVYAFDDDELDKDQAYGHELKILGLGEPKVGFAPNSKATPRPPGIAADGSQSSGSASASAAAGAASGLGSPSVSDAERISRLGSIAKEMTFVRVKVPGPSARTITMKFDSDQVRMSLRDLYFELNRKKQEVYFHALYFDLFYEGETKTGSPLTNETKICDLKKPSLIVLPKPLSESDPEIEEAYQFPLVRLAYQYEEWKANKIRSGRKKGRILGVDYFKITKHAVDEIVMDSSQVSSTDDDHTLDSSVTDVSHGVAGSLSGAGHSVKKSGGGFLSSFSGKMIKKADHVPIDIVDVVNVAQLADDPRQCKLSYMHPKSGVTSHFYEMKSAAHAKQFVDKIAFLRELHTLRPKP